MQKRQAAANIFMEQNVIPQQAVQTGDMEEERASAEFRVRSASAAPSPAAPPPLLKTSEELQLEKEPIRVRETGFMFWRRVIVPPNAYVVHTRAGKKQPVTLGLGLSFGYNPYTDAYLVVPAAMQTIGVVANCISKEKQGINVLAYVQWQIDNFGVAYRKLDFSDTHDPLGIVNAQLREQAEAAIKDKIATMSVEEVLTDKEPVIEELTTRLKAVAEGREQGGDEGLGIKIVTVQIKEAYVSSKRLWENLQAPFRYEKDKMARISLLATQDEIHQKELETRRLSETRQAETMVEIERIQQSKQTEAAQIRVSEEATRFTQEQESLRRKIQLEEQTTLTRRESEQRLALQEAQTRQTALLEAMRREQEKAIEQTRLDADAAAQQKALQVEQILRELAEQSRQAQAEFEATQAQMERDLTLRRQEFELKLAEQEQRDRLQTQALQSELARHKMDAQLKLDLEEAANRVKAAMLGQEVEIEGLRQKIRNMISRSDLSGRLIEKLPDLVAGMPEIHELKVLQTGGGGFDALSQFLAQVLALADSLGIPLRPEPPRSE